MARTRTPLLAELHAHTTWSDGELGVGEIVDLYGMAGVDVLAVTDHVVRSAEGLHVRADNFAAYLAEIDTEAERAARQYGLLLVPVLELTLEDEDPRRARSRSGGRAAALRRR
jgi:3',5'-nucleoside bisphosphate phosphatase